MIRNLIALALLGLAAAVSANVRYAFKGMFDHPSGGSYVDAFTLVVPTFITSTRTFSLSQLESYDFRSAVPYPRTKSVTLSFSKNFKGTWESVNCGSALHAYSLPFGTLSRYGTTWMSNDYSYCSLTVSSVPAAPVPEPSGLAALGFGAVAFLRRRTVRL